MTRRLLLFALILLAIAPGAVAKRRAVRPGGDCAGGTLFRATYASPLAVDDQFVYVINESSTLARVPKVGGERQILANLEAWLPIAMIVDATTVYVSALPIESMATPMPGSILAIPKGGGAVSVFASDVATAYTIVQDEEHLYWADAGVFDFSNGEYRDGGRIERMRKDGSGRQFLRPICPLLSIS